MPAHRIPEQVAPGRRLGRHVNHDPRSLRYLVGAPARALQSVEHERVIPVLDQGELGSCTGNAAVGALGTKPLYDALPDDHPHLDEDFAVQVYSSATEIDPYDGQYPPDDTGSDGLSVSKVCKSLGLVSGYLTATSVSAMQNALQSAPVIVGVHWYEGFDNPDGDGLVEIFSVVVARVFSVRWRLITSETAKPQASRRALWHVPAQAPVVDVWVGTEVMA